MENTALSKLIGCCIYNYQNSIQKYKESMGTFYSIVRISKTHIKLKTEKGDIDCKKMKEDLELAGELNETIFKKLIKNNYDLINFLQNYKGNFFSTFKDRYYGKRKMNIFKSIKLLYPFLPYEPTHISTEGINFRYEINVGNYVQGIDIVFQLESMKNSSESILSYTISDSYLYSEISRYSSDPLAVLAADRKEHLPAKVTRSYKFDPDNIKSVFNYVLYNYSSILEEELSESYAETNSLERLEVLKLNYNN